MLNCETMVKKNVYSHKIDLLGKHIKNCDKDAFRKKLEDIPYRGYEVEQLKDGRKIVITKPGGKKAFGRMKREDIMVWIYNEKDDTLWLISHNNIYVDLEEKSKIDKKETIKIIAALEKVFHGEDPEDILKNTKLTNPNGEEPEVLLKAYKWIWGQEDCNYPDGEGRAMSWDGINDLMEKLKSEVNNQK